MTEFGEQNTLVKSKIQLVSDIDLMETDDGTTFIIRKPDERTIKQEIKAPIFKKTKPEFIVHRKPKLEKRFLLPPSKCELTINERFTAITCHLQKKEIEPGLYGLKCPNTLIGRLQRCKAARASAAPYTNSRQATPARKTGDDSDERVSYPAPLDFLDEPEHEPGESLSAMFAKFMQRRDYCTGPSKSRDELDSEIDQYFIDVGGRGIRVFKRKTREMLEKLYRAQYGLDPEVDLNDRISNISINCTSNEDQMPAAKATPKETNLFSAFVKHIKSNQKLFRKEKEKDKDALDADLDDYLSARRNPRSLSESLDDDLENYKRQDPRNQKSQLNSSIGDTSNDNQEDDDFEEYMN